MALASLETPKEPLNHALDVWGDTYPEGELG